MFLHLRLTQTLSQVNNSATDTILFYLPIPAILCRSECWSMQSCKYGAQLNLQYGHA